MDNSSFSDVQMITTIAVAIANIVLVILTSFYVMLTWRIVLEMKRAKGPSVYFDLELPDKEMRVAICNSGQSAALNVKFQIEEDIPWRKMGEHQVGLNALNVISQGISYIPAGRTLKYVAGYPDWDKIDEQNPFIKVQVSFQDESGQQFTREYVIDMNQYKTILFESFRDPSREIAKAIRDVEYQRESRDRMQGFLRSPIRTEIKKQCPMCGELIPKVAKKCSHCHEILDDESDTSANIG